MKYDPIKRWLGDFFNRSVWLRILFYKLLDLLLLRAWHIHKEIRKWARKKSEGIQILDAGAGFGQYTYYLSRLNRQWNIIAVDVKQDQVSDCNEFFQKIHRSNVIFKVADLTSFMRKECFDLILCVDVMEHIEEDQKVFENFYQSMKKEGMLLISTPSDQGGSDVHEKGEESFIEEHVRNGYNADEIKAKLKKAGFSKVSVRYSYGRPGQVSWKLSMKYPMLLLGVSKVFFVVLPFYYLLVYPFCFFLNLMDISMAHKTGTGLIVKAWK